MGLQKIAEELNGLFDVNRFDEYNGIQVANQGPITAIATAVTADLETIEKAVKLGVNLLIVHHGIFRKGDSPILEGTKYKRIRSLIQNNMGLLCYHLPLDYHRTLGNNWKAARDLGWNNLEPFGEYNKMLIGVRGKFPTVSFENFKKKIEAYYGHLAVTGPIKKDLSSAALISGSGYRSISEAAQAGVDALITGNFDEPAWSVSHEEGIAFFALGHTATEKIGPKALADYISTRYTIPCTFIDTSNLF